MVEYWVLRIINDGNVPGSEEKFAIIFGFPTDNQYKWKTNEHSAKKTHREVIQTII